MELNLDDLIVIYLVKRLLRKWKNGFSAAAFVCCSAEMFSYKTVGSCSLQTFCGGARWGGGLMMLTRPDRQLRSAGGWVDTRPAGAQQGRCSELFEMLFVVSFWSLSPENRVSCCLSVAARGQYSMKWQDNAEPCLTSLLLKRVSDDITEVLTVTNVALPSTSTFRKQPVQDLKLKDLQKLSWPLF